MVDSEETCIVVMVYNTADSWGVLIGDTVVIPEPQVKRHSITHKDEVSVSHVCCSGVLLCLLQSFLLRHLTGMFPLCGSRLTSGVYEWTLLCSSLSMEENRVPRAR